jgi:hypothetical protein
LHDEQTFDLHAEQLSPQSPLPSLSSLPNSHKPSSSLYPVSHVKQRFAWQVIQNFGQGRHEDEDK